MVVYQNETPVFVNKFLHENHQTTIDNHCGFFYINGRNSLSSVLERVEIVKFLHHTRLWCEY